ncbi:MAG TPA: DUF4160 domain-containing protein [Longimicrobiaceae bacterium]|nr:DUF4160 domain-containing protein [Longimicrobiaceae bacterium]
MPVVLRVGGHTFTMFPGDHDPPHVHARCGGHTCKLEIASLKLSQSNMNASEEAKTLRLVAAHSAALLAAWNSLRQREGR